MNKKQAKLIKKIRKTYAQMDKLAEFRPDTFEGKRAKLASNYLKCSVIFLLDAWGR